MNLNMISNYVKAKWSKGIDSKKVDITTKDIRLLSCFGNGDDIAVCPALRPSERKMGKFMCGECGCGDKATTWLNGEEQEYTKLDHPYLSCPRKMPGFSDYESSIKDSENFQEKRKHTIEVTLGTTVLKMKSLIKPEMSKEEIKKQQEEKNKDCPSCKIKAMVRNEIVERLKAEGHDPDFKNEEYTERFRELWENDDRVKDANNEIKKKNQAGAGCTKCERKKQLREEAQAQLKDSGLEGAELQVKINEFIKMKIREESA